MLMFNDVLDAYVRPYAGAIGDAFLLQDDNATRHRARIADDYLQQETIMRMEWPARSPDLNPIEHVSDALERRSAALSPPPQTFAELATALQEQWLSLPMELIDRITESITHRLPVLCFRSAIYKGREIAVKIITREKLSVDFSTRFLPREIKALSQIRHKNIIHIFKIFNYPRRVYIFMELVDRGDLLSYIKTRGKLLEKEARHYFSQMVSALKYLHNIEIAHRDLKCENIMINNQDEIKIIDFGFCRCAGRLMTDVAVLISQDLTFPSLPGNAATTLPNFQKCLVNDKGRRELSQTYCGSTAYAAPEVLQGTPYNPMMYDVWSLGCVLFIMVTGTMPFDDSNVRKMVSHQLRRHIKYPASSNVSQCVKVHHQLEFALPKYFRIVDFR
ncbi:Testis-specific serine/threonine-protein kinase 1, partial [Stegodyphus mimosarum]